MILMRRKAMIHVLTYTMPHRKTYDTLCLLKARGYSNVTVWATPLSYVKTYIPRVEHRPSWTLVEDQTYIRELGYFYREIHECSEIVSSNQDDVFLLCGGGLLEEKFLENHIVINSHPGYIPQARGLDSYKWSIYLGLPIGVTTHIIGKEIDAGEIIERRKIKVEKNDTFHTVAQRVYETEVYMLVNAISKLNCKHDYIKGEMKIFKRMPNELESELYKKFEEYKKNFKSVI